MNFAELKILDFIHSHFSCGFLDFLMPIITKFGDKGIFWISVTVLLICFKKTRKTGLTAGLALALGAVICNLILKNAVARIRPYDLNELIRPELLVPALSDYSFPSGHTAASFEAATAMLLNERRLGIPALVLAVLIALSRLYLYVHYPTDVLIGAVLGILAALFSQYIVNKLYGRRSSRLKGR